MTRLLQMREESIRSSSSSRCRRFIKVAPVGARLACQKVRGPFKLYCPSYPKITTGDGSLRTLVLNPHVDGVARLWASKLVLHRTTHASQCVAHLLLARRRLSRSCKKCCFTCRPKTVFESIDAGGQPQALHLPMLLRSNQQRTQNQDVKQPRPKWR